MASESRNLMFVCKKCNRLCCSSISSWNNSNKKKGLQGLIGENKINKLSDILFIYKLDETNKWIFNDRIEENKGYLEKRGVLFPICNRCISLYCSNMIRMQNFLLNETRLLKKCPKYQKMLINELKSIKRKIDQLKLANEHPATSRISVNEEELLFYHVNKTIPKRRESIIMFSSVKSLSHSLMISSLFSISSYRHYGTINGCRIGTLTPDVVPWDEIDHGLYFLVNLFKVLAESVNMRIESIRLNANINILLPKKESVLTSNLLKVGTKKSISLFNDCISYMFSLFHILFLYFKDNSKYIFGINVSEHTVGGVSYLYNSDAPYEWTHAMKCVLINFKMLQTCGDR